MSSQVCKPLGMLTSLAYTPVMRLRRTSYAVYDTGYHLVWVPKYHKWILGGDVQQRVRELFEEVAVNHDTDIDAMEIPADYVHLFISFPPRYSIARSVELFKSISANVLFREFPELQDQL